MVSLGALSFFTPWALAGFLVLPVVWWIVRLTPPRPRRTRFPAIRLLSKIDSSHQSSKSYPWWLLVLRLLTVSALIVAAAGPVFNPQSPVQATGPLVLIVDDGWAAANDWQARIDYLENLNIQAERQGRGVILIPTAHPITPIVPGVLTPAEARESIRALRPKPWQTDRSQIMRVLSNPTLALTKAGRIVWMSDGLLSDDSPDEINRIFSRLSRIGPVTFVAPKHSQHAHALFPPYSDGDTLVVPIRRAVAGAVKAVNVVAYDNGGRAIGQAPAMFDTTSHLTEARLELPVETRNRIEQLRLEEERSAGTVVLLDERWRRRPVGLVSTDGIGDDQPLLSGQYYLDRALQPVTEVRNGDVNQLLDREIAVMVLIDPAPLTQTDIEDITRWVDHGGILTMFAGPRLAALGSGDIAALDGRTAGLKKLLPVQLRSGDRAIGGALSWRRPATIAPFSSASPFNGLIIPSDVRIRRQVLAEPTLALNEKTWARLTDGTPLVTAEPRGEGMVVLFHITANAEWSNLPLSGLFVEMLKRIVQTSHGIGGGQNQAGLMMPQRTIDGFGNLSSPPSDTLPLTWESFDITPPDPRHPPGFYGSSDQQRALNLTSGLAPLRAIEDLPQSITRDVYGNAEERSLAHLFFVVAAILLILDMLVSFWLRGITFKRFPTVSATPLLLAILAYGTFTFPALGQEQKSGDDQHIDAANTTRIAYVLTGDRQTDMISRQGLIGLGDILARRTAVELGSPVGVDPAVDELVFYPLIYWPVIETSPVPSALAAKQVNDFLANGGTILFDTLTPESKGNVRQMRQFANVLDIPRLIPVPGDHVLTRAFYLLNEFPGRWAGSPVWVVPAEERVNDGVSPVLVGNHNWAGAWAVDEERRPMFAAVPGGERQREHAYRFGVNLVMYVLTGNYKGDQVHLPIIMNRLGQ